MMKTMLKKIIDNVKENSLNLKDIEYLFSLKKKDELEKIYSLSHEINENFHEKINYESNIYYPTIYQIEDNCPTCGYRSMESRRKYTHDFIVKNVEYKLQDIKEYPISGINCYNKDISGIRELLIILDTLSRFDDLKINVRVSNYEHIKHLDRHNIDSVIIQTSQNKASNFNQKYNENYDEREEKMVKYIKENMNLKITYEFLINYNEGYTDILDKISEIEKYDVDSIEIKGYDPFIDSPEEYNPQYTRDYILKIISLLRIAFPTKEIKIQYATNDNNYLEDYIKLGVNTITGIYTPHLNSKLENTDIIH